MPLDITALFVAVPVVGLTVLAMYFLCREWAEEPGASEQEPEERASWVDRASTAATWLLALVYIVMGLPKLGTLSGVVHQFEHWGYSPTFMYVIGALEFLGAIVILLPRIRLFAAGGLS
ncbi:MAG: DoxX family protein, partial [Bradymonadaceae bacterium]